MSASYFVNVNVSLDFKHLRWKKQICWPSYVGSSRSTKSACFNIDTANVSRILKKISNHDGMMESVSLEKQGSDERKPGKCTFDAGSVKKTLLSNACHASHCAEANSKKRLTPQNSQNPPVELCASSQWRALPRDHSALLHRSLPAEPTNHLPWLALEPH